MARPALYLACAAARSRWPSTTACQRATWPGSPDSTGAELAHKTYWVRQWEQMQLSLAGELLSISTVNARLSVEVLSGTGKVIAFGSSVANGSQDPSTFEMSFADSLLAENAAGGITAVTAGMGLSGGGSAGSVTLSVGAGVGIEVDADSVGLAARGVTTGQLASAAVTKGKLSAAGGTSGQVLGTDGDVLRWQNDGLSLPFEATASPSTGPALKVTNVSSGAYAYGVEAIGNSAGGYFGDTSGSGHARVGSGNLGIAAYGDDAGGSFLNTNTSAFANVAYEDYGIEASGADAGGYFQDSDGSGYASVGTADYGITAYGSYAGGYFKDTDSSAWVDVAYNTYKIVGNGTASFVQNHPYEQGLVIVYAAPEGDEVATYTRGTAKLVNGEARVPLGETFRWVTNPDIGLTTYLTPVGEWSDLFVAERTTEELVVRSAGGARDATFDYMVYGLRIGFEESSIVQEKEQQAYLPSMAEHRHLYQRRPDLRPHSPLERFKAMRTAIGDESEPDLRRAHALQDAILELDPASYELPGGHEQLAAPEAIPVAVRSDEGVLDDSRSNGGSTNTGSIRALPGDQSSRIPVDAEGNVYATSYQTSSRNLASWLDASEAVEPGDVLVIDRTRPGMMRRAFEASDTRVVGVVVAASGVVLGSRPLSAGEIDPAVAGDPVAGDSDSATVPSYRAAVALAGIVGCRVDAAFGAIWPGDLLVTSPTHGHAMRADSPLPGTMLGKALEPLAEGTGTINVLVMLR